jgi:hypothetical protein
MRVIAHLIKFTDWEPVPSDVKVTPQDIAAGKVMPDRNGGYRMKVVKTMNTFREMHIAEHDIVGKIIHEKTDIRRAGRVFSRKEAVAHLLMDNLLEDYDWSWITKFEVHDDGPDEKLARGLFSPHTSADHGRRRGQKNIDPASLEAHVAKYLESATAADHAAFLTAHFGVKG